MPNAYLGWAQRSCSVLGTWDSHESLGLPYDINGLELGVDVSPFFASEVLMDWCVAAVWTGVP